MLLKIPSHRHSQPVKLPCHQLASMLARARGTPAAWHSCLSPVRGGERESVLLPQQSEWLGDDGGLGSLHGRAAANTRSCSVLAAGASLGWGGTTAVSLQWGPAWDGGALLLEGSLRTPRHLSHPDGAPKSQNKRRLPMRWFHPQLFISKS